MRTAGGGNSFFVGLSGVRSVLIRGRHLRGFVNLRVRGRHSHFLKRLKRQALPPMHPLTQLHRPGWGAFSVGRRPTSEMNKSSLWTEGAAGKRPDNAIYCNPNFDGGEIVFIPFFAGAPFD